MALGLLTALVAINNVEAFRVGAGSGRGEAPAPAQETRASEASATPEAASSTASPTPPPVPPRPSKTAWIDTNPAFGEISDAIISEHGAGNRSNFEPGKNMFFPAELYPAIVNYAKSQYPLVLEYKNVDAQAVAYAKTVFPDGGNILKRDGLEFANFKSGLMFQFVTAYVSAVESQPEAFTRDYENLFRRLVTDYWSNVREVSGTPWPYNFSEYWQGWTDWNIFKPKARLDILQHRAISDVALIFWQVLEEKFGNPLSAEEMARIKATQTARTEGSLEAAYNPASGESTEEGETPPPVPPREEIGGFSAEAEREFERTESTGSGFN